MRKFTPKPNAVATAVKAANDESKLAAQIREAALVMPIKDAMRDLAIRARVNVDEQLLAVVERFLGEKLTDPKVVEGRLSHMACDGEFKGTVYLMDGVPVLFVGALDLQRDGDSVEAAQDVRHLLPEGYVAPGRIIVQ